MDAKTIQCQIQIEEGLLDLTLLHSDMLRTYVILDMLMDDVFNEVCFHDPLASQKLFMRKSSDSINTIGDNSMYLSENGIDCIKELISQCYLNPYNATWLHYDIEAQTSDGNDATLYIHLDSTTNSHPK